MPDSDDDDFYTYYSDDPDFHDPPSDDGEDEETNTATPTVATPPAPTPISHAPGKSLPLRILKGTFKIVGGILAAALVVGSINSRNKK